MVNNVALLSKTVLNIPDGVLDSKFIPSELHMSHCASQLNLSGEHLTMNACSPTLAALS